MVTEQSTPEPEPTQKPSGRKMPWKLVSCVLAGLGGVLAAVLMNGGDPAPPSGDDATVRPQAELRQLVPAEPAALLRDAQEQLRAGNVGPAFRSFRKFAATTTSLPDESIQYQMAVSAEGVGETRSAITFFERLSTSAQSEQLRAASIVGLARIRFRERQYAAVNDVLAARLVTGQLSVTDAIQTEAEYLRALALARFALNADDLPLLDDQALMPGQVTWSVPAVLDLAGAGNAAPTSAVEDTRWTEQPGLQVAGQGLNAVVQASSRDQSIREIGDTLLKAAGVPVTWSARADKSASTATTTVHATHLSVGSVLDRLLNGPQLVWTGDGRQVHILAASEADAATLESHGHAQATRALWDAVTRFPDGPAAALAMLNIGNLAAKTDPLDAEARYQEVLRQHRIVSVRRAAEFNRGKIALWAGTLDDAAHRFLTAAEYGNGTYEDAVALLFVGRMHLELGEAGVAEQPLRRAVGYLDQAPTRREDHARTEVDDALAHAVQTLSLALIAQNQPLSANRELMLHRKLLQMEPYRDATAFLTALAAYQASTSDEQRLREGRTLVAALAHVRPRMLFAQNAVILIGQAWNDLGLSAHMAALYQQQLNRVRSPWIRRRMLLDLVEYHRTTGNAQQIESLLQMLAADPVASDDHVQLVSATHALEVGRTNEALSICRQLLDQDGVDKAAVLKTMGRAFEQQDDFENAAICFAGMLPPAVRQSAEVTP